MAKELAAKDFCVVYETYMATSQKKYFVPTEEIPAGIIDDSITYRDNGDFTYIIAKLDGPEDFVENILTSSDSYLDPEMEPDEHPIMGNVFGLEGDNFSYVNPFTGGGGECKITDVSQGMIKMAMNHKERNDFADQDKVNEYHRLLGECAELKQAFCAYVENDLEVAEPDYVREVLSDVCGLDEGDLDKFGLGGLISEIEDPQR